MFVLSQFLIAAAQLLSQVLTVYMWIVIVRALISWVNPDPWNPIVQFLYRITDPVLRPIQRRLPTWRTGVDFAPFVVILAIQFLQWFLVPVLIQAASELR